MNKKYEKQNVKVWFIIQSCVIMIYPNFYAFYHKAKWWLDGKDNANVYLDYIWIVCYKTNVKDAYILSENNKDMKIKNYPSEMGIWIVCWIYINQILIKKILH